MLMGLSRLDKMRQYLSDAGQTSTVVGYDDSGAPITVEETPVGVTPDDSSNFIPASVDITGAVQRSGAPTAAQLMAQQTAAYAPIPDVSITPSVQATPYGAPTYSDGTPLYSAPSVTTSPPPNTSAADIAKAVTGLVTGGLTAYQTVQLQQMQLQRINQGLPPLTAAQLASVYPNLPQYSAQSQNMTMMLLVGGAALLLLMASKKKHV